jgi:hypothetical protein
MPPIIMNNKTMLQTPKIDNFFTDFYQFIDEINAKHISCESKIVTNYGAVRGNN